MMQEDTLMSMAIEDKYKLSHRMTSRIVIVGETGVGKTTLFKSFINDQLQDPVMAESNQ